MLSPSAVYILYHKGLNLVRTSVASFIMQSFTHFTWGFILGLHVSSESYSCVHTVSEGFILCSHVSGESHSRVHAVLGDLCLARMSLLSLIIIYILYRWGLYLVRTSVASLIIVNILYLKCLFLVCSSVGSLTIMHILYFGSYT